MLCELCVLLLSTDGPHSFYVSANSLYVSRLPTATASPFFGRTRVAFKTSARMSAMPCDPRKVRNCGDGLIQVQCNLCRMISPERKGIPVSGRLANGEREHQGKEHKKLHFSRIGARNGRTGSIRQKPPYQVSMFRSPKSTPGAPDQLCDCVFSHSKMTTQSCSRCRIRGCGWRSIKGQE